MPYATLEDLIERAGQKEILETADRDKDGVADPDVVAAAIASAEAEINGYVAAQYELPLTEVPALVKNWAVSIGRFYLHRFSKPDYVQAGYDAAVAQLRDVAAGKVKLPQESGQTPQTSSGSYLVSAPPPRFGRKTLRGFFPC